MSFNSVKKLCNICGGKKKKNQPPKTKTIITRTNTSETAQTLSEFRKEFFTPSENSKFITAKTTNEENKEATEFVLKKYRFLRSIDGICTYKEGKTLLTHRGKGFKKGKLVHFGRFQLTENKTPKALVFVFHGLGSSIQYEMNWGAYSAQFGIETIGFDMPTYGLSVPDDKLNLAMGPPGIIVDYKNLCRNGLSFIENWYVKDEDNKKKYQNIPFFLWGESLGGATVIGMSTMMKTHWKDNTELIAKFKGCINIAPAIGMSGNINFSKMMQMEWMNFWKPKLRFKKNKEKDVPASRIKEIFDIFYSEKHTTKTLKLSSYIQLLKMVNWVFKSAKNYDIPTLFHVGEKDTVVENEKIFQFFRSCESKDKSLVFWKEGMHFLVGDYTAKVIADVTIRWIVERS